MAKRECANLYAHHSRHREANARTCRNADYLL